MRIISSVHEIDERQNGDHTIAPLLALIDEARSVPERESYCTDEIGQRTFEVVLASYTTPQGESRWAVYTSDNEGEAYLDSGDEEEASTRYEAEVREFARCADASMYAWWEVTDVEGLAQNTHLYDLAARADADADWNTVEQGQIVLGQNRDADVEYDDLERAAHRLVDRRFGGDADGNTEARVTFWTHSRDNKPVAVEVVELVPA
jgi:hypothetical protein